MGLFGKLLKTTFDVVTIPIDIVKDVVVGDVDIRKESFTGKKFELLGNDLQEVRNEIDNL